jgi:hypothetical protein
MSFILIARKYILYINIARLRFIFNFKSNLILKLSNLLTFKYKGLLLAFSLFYKVTYL